MKKILTVLATLVLVCATHAQKIDVLQTAAKSVNLEQLCREPYTPYPPYTDRAYWESLPEVVKSQAIAMGEKALDYRWSSVTVTSYLDFGRKGIRIPNDEHIAARYGALGSLVLAELIEGKGRFMDAIADGAWSLCEQSTWVATAHIALQGSGVIPNVNRRAIDLSAGETANALSWCYYFFGTELGKMSPIIPQRIADELNNHILRVFTERDDQWWMVTKEGAFVNNWTPWCSFNVLTTALLVEKDPVRKAQIVAKTMRSVDQFINYYKNDGGCEEGPTYWDHAGGKLMEYLSLLDRFSGGQLNGFTNERVRNMGLYIAKAHIDSLYFVNFADAEAKAVPIPTTIYRYGKAIEDEPLMQFGSYIASIAGFRDAPLSGSLDMRLWQTQLYDQICQTQTYAPLYGQVWLPGIEMAMARSTNGSSKGFTFAAKGGFNDESHNHNDAGSFVLYLNGQPMIIDVGVGTYTAKTFSNQRYELWHVQSEYHNLPIINGYGQSNGKQYRAQQVKHNDNGRVMNFSMQLAHTYPEKAECKSWIRTYRLDRAKRTLNINDNYQLAKTFATVSTTIMTDAEVEHTKSGTLKLTYRGQIAYLKFDPRKVDFTSQNIPLNDPRMTKIWGADVKKLNFTVRNAIITTGDIPLSITY